ncbi:MAG: ABC transporter [Firmicutes bacterium HGW-Firmicutes-2]|jgi:zinc transport system permease protein|nr:MAG: ABC transporter [Firmicutes bacterium HGW-Firmicutes-2]
MNQIVSSLIEAFQYQFIIKALLVGSLIAFSSSVMGIFLVLKKFSMIGDGLAHVSFATVAIALLFNASPLIVSIPVVILASFLILKLNEKAGLHGDAAIGLVSSFSVAFGVLLASMSNGFNVDLFSYLFGSILIISDIDLIFSLILSIVVVIGLLLFYNALFAVTHDEEFAEVIGIDVKLMNRVIAVLTSITIVLGIRVVGTMLISSMIIFPTVTALQLSRSFKQTIVIAVAISIFCVIAGVLASFVFNLPSGATIVMLNAFFFAIFFVIKRIGGQS